MWLWANAEVPEPPTRITAPAATARARRVAFIWRDSRKLGSVAATTPLTTMGPEEPEGGFEPPTYHLRGGCSTPELLRRGRQDTGRLRPGSEGSGATTTDVLTEPPFLEALGAAMMRP